MARVSWGRTREDDLTRSAARANGTSDGQELRRREAISRHRERARAAAEAVAEATWGQGARVGDVAVGTECQVREVSKADRFSGVSRQGEGARGITCDTATVEPAHGGGIVTRNGQGAAALQDELVVHRERTRSQSERATVDEDLVLIRNRGAGEGVQAREGLVTRALLGQREAGRLEDEFGVTAPGGGSG